MWHHEYTHSSVTSTLPLEPEPLPKFCEVCQDEKKCQLC